jgi:hypothetical protein
MAVSCYCPKERDQASLRTQPACVPAATKRLLQSEQLALIVDKAITTKKATGSYCRQSNYYNASD